MRESKKKMIPPVNIRGSFLGVHCNYPPSSAVEDASHVATKTVTRSRELSEDG